MRFLTRILPVTIVVLALAASASAKRVTVAPPGDSGISQYAEVVPTGAGASPPRAGGGVEGGGQGALTPRQRGQLNALGPNGRALVAVVDATAPQTFGIPAAGVTTTRSGARTGTAGHGQGGATAPGVGAGTIPDLRSGSGGSPVSMILSAAAGQGGGGVGVLLPGLMVASAFAAALLVVRRRRTSP